MPPSDPVDSFEKQQKAIKEKIKKAAKDSDSKILKAVAKDKEDEPEMRKKMSLLHMLFREMTEQIEEGDMKMDAAVDDFAKAVKEIS